MASTVASGDSFGCEHYKRKCAFVSPCCGKVYTCRICHDSKENHNINRHQVSEIECLHCSLRQRVRSECIKCNTVFGKYFCTVCKLFDDTDKKQFHCNGCGICRVGGKENFYHCNKCDMCLGLQLQFTHKNGYMEFSQIIQKNALCIEKASKSNCPICLEYLHTSLESSHVPPCGHLVHGSCFQSMLESGNYACPICSESMVEMNSVWSRLDNEIAHTRMPEEYQDYFVQILCRDCHQESRVRFHVLGLKCQECGSYNTCRTSEPPTGESQENAAAHNE